MITRLTAATLLALTSVVTTAQAASGAGPYYAPPAWALKLPCASQANCPRFVVLTDWNDEAVLDRETGLVWERTVHHIPSSYLSQRTRCLDIVVGGRSGWRLPALHELQTLRDLSSPVNPKLPPGHPFITVGNTLFGGFWTTADGPTGNVSQKRIMRFIEGNAETNVSINRTLDDDYFGWCVRGRGDEGLAK